MNRRMMLGTASLPLGLAAAAPADMLCGKADTDGLLPSPDAELLLAVDRFQAIHAIVMANEADDDCPWGDIEAAGEKWHAAANALCGITPTTARGMIAKAAAVVAILRVIVGGQAHSERFDEDVEVHHRLALDMALDVARLAGGAA